MGRLESTMVWISSGSDCLLKKHTFAVPSCFAISSLICLCFAIEKKMKELTESGKYPVFARTKEMDLCTYLLNLLGAFDAIFWVLGPPFGPSKDLFIRTAAPAMPRPGKTKNDVSFWSWE